MFFLCLMHSEGGLLLRPLGPTGAPGDVLNVTEEPTLAATAVPTASADVNVTRVREFYDIDHLDWGQVRWGANAGVHREVHRHSAPIVAA